jgi:hypothetical protein
MRRDHLATRLGTVVARIGAPLAVVHLMLAAFIRTSLADFRTKGADFLFKAGVPAHEGSRGPAHRRTVAIEPDAFDHPRDFLFVQASIVAMLAGPGAFDTRVNALLVVRVVREHAKPPKSEREISVLFRAGEQICPAPQGGRRTRPAADESRNFRARSAPGNDIRQPWPRTAMGRRRNAN